MHHRRHAIAIVALALAGIAGEARAGLVGHWVADDWSGSGDWTDRVGGKIATPVGDPAVVSDGFGKAVAGDGIDLDGNDFFNVFWTNNPIGQATSMTVVAMFRTSTGGVNNDGNWFNNSGIVGAEASGVTNDWGLMLMGDGKPRGAFAGAGGGGSLIGPDSVVDNQVHTTAITWRDPDAGGDGKLRFYVDGQLVGTSSGAEDYYTGVYDGSFAIGSNYYNGWAHYTGQVGEVRFYNSVEDVASVHAAMTTSAVPEPASLALLGAGAALLLRRKR